MPNDAVTAAEYLSNMEPGQLMIVTRLTDGTWWVATSETEMKRPLLFGMGPTLQAAWDDER